MADDEQFSLCWNNFNSNLSAGFHESLCRGDLVDVTLAAEGQLVKAHRLVLSVCSPYFRKMFTQMPANQHAFVFLKDVSHSALKDLIQFMYCGEVNVKQEALPAFISTAEALQIKGLTDSDPSPSGQPPSEPTTPTPQLPQVQTSPRTRQQRTVAATRSYKIETVDEASNDSKPQTTQIVIQTTAASVSQPTAITSYATQPASGQHHHQQQQQQHHHIQTQHHHQQHPQQQQLQSQNHQISTVSIPSGSISNIAATTTHVVGSSHKRPAQRSSIGSVAHVKRSKTSTIDPLEGAEANGGGATQQITIQTAIVSDPKTQQHQQSETAEYIDLPLELPTKSEPDYTDETGEVDPNEQDATYVEDESYGDMRYDETYFAENEDGGGGSGVTTTGTSTTTAGNINISNATNAGNVTVGIGNATSSGGGGGVVGSAAATTSKAIIKQQQNTSFSESSYAEGTDQTNNDAQDIDNDNDGNTLLEAQSVIRKRGRPKKLIKHVVAPISVKAKIEEAVSKNESQPAIYASTTKGTVKLLYDGHHFRYSFRKGKYSIFQCCYKENKEECKVRVITDHKLVYPLDGEHVHYVHATDKSVTSVKFTPGAEVNDAKVEKGHVIVSGKEVINNDDDDDDELHQQELQIVSLDEHFPEFAETIDTKNIKYDEMKQQSEAKLSTETKSVLHSSSTDAIVTPSGTASIITTNVENTLITTSICSGEVESEQPIEDPNDFREKIKKRLQKALLGKKKQ